MTENKAQFLPLTPREDSSFGLSTERLLSNESLKAIMENYIQYYALGEGHTARAKRYDLQYFLEFLTKDPKNVPNVRVADWTLQATKDFIEERLSLAESPATVQRRVATLKHFGRTLAERVPGFINPAREAKAPSFQTSRPHGLTENETFLLREVAKSEVEKSKDSFQALRNQFILELLLATGLRADEIRLLSMVQVSDDVNWLKSVKTKGKKFRNVYLSSDIRSFFELYLLKRDEELRRAFPLFSELTPAEANKFPVLISMYRADVSKPASLSMSAKSIWRVVAHFGTLARALSGDPMPNLHPHKLRHTFAHGLLDSSKDVRLVAQALGHSDVRTTMRYTERTEEEIAKAIERKTKASK